MNFEPHQFQYGVVNLASSNKLSISNCYTDKVSSNQSNTNYLQEIEQSQISIEQMKTMDIIYVVIPCEQALAELFVQLDTLCYAEVVFIMISDDIDIMLLSKKTPRNATIYPISYDSPKDGLAHNHTVNEHTMLTRQHRLLDVTFRHFRALMIALEGSDSIFWLNFYDVIDSQRDAKLGYFKTISAHSLDALLCEIKNTLTKESKPKHAYFTKPTSTLVLVECEDKFGICSLSTILEALDDVFDVYDQFFSLSPTLENGLSINLITLFNKADAQ